MYTPPDLDGFALLKKARSPSLLLRTHAVAGYPPSSALVAAFDSSADQLGMLNVTIPAGIAAGDQFQASTPSGLMLVTVPPGVKAGDTIQIAASVAPAPMVMMDQVRGTWFYHFEVANWVGTSTLEYPGGTSATGSSSSKCYCCPGCYCILCECWCFPCCSGGTRTMNYDVDPSEASFRTKDPFAPPCCLSPFAPSKESYIKGTLAPGSTADLITCNLTGYRPADICNGIFWCMEGQSGTGTLVIDMRAKTMTTNMQYLVQGGLGDGARPKGGGALSSVMHKQ